MRLAVIIPCYNHAQYVGDAIESVLTQSRPADRVIVIVVVGVFVGVFTLALG
mgnify:CR=1 FL=1